MTLFELMGRIVIENKDAIKGINDTERAADTASGKMNTSFGKVGGLLKGALLGAAGLAASAVGAIGIAGVRGAAELETATGKMRAALGLTEEDAKRMGGVVTDLYRSGVGGSITEAAEKVTMLRQVMGDLTDEQTQKLTSMAATIQDVYGADYQSTVSAAQTLTEQFGLTGQQAMDFITTGFENGLDRSGDFLDSVGEYATQFSNGGADAGQFFSVLESGLQGSVNGTDKAADAFKEFRLRIQDGSSLTADSLEMIGLSSDEMAQKISSGQMTAAEAFQLVITKLGETEDPMVRMQAGAGLIGTQFEDLGDDAVAALSMTTTSLEDMTGATDKAADAAYNNLSSSWTTFSRTLQGIATEVIAPFVPMLTDLLSVMTEKAPLMIDAARSVSTYLQQWSPQIQGFISEVGTVATDVFTIMALLWTNVLKPSWQTIEPFVTGLFGALGNSIKAFKLILEGDFIGAWSEAVEGLKSFLTGLEGFLDNFFGGLWSLVKPGLIGMRDAVLAKGEEIRDGFSEKLTELKTAVFEWSVDLWAGIASTMASFVGKVITTAVDVYNGFTTEIAALKDWTVGVFSRLWDDISGHLTAFTQNIVDEIAGIPGRLSDLGQQIADSIMGQIRKAIPGTKKASEELADEGVLKPVKEALEVRSPSRALYAVGTAVVQGLTQGVSDPAEVARVQTAAASLGERVLVAALDGLGITKPENPYVTAGQAMMQGVLDGLESRMPQLTDFWNRVRDARPDVPLMTGWNPGGEMPSATVTPGRPTPTPQVSAEVAHLVNVVIPQVSAAFGRLVNIDMPQVSAAVTGAVNIMNLGASASVDAWAAYKFRLQEDANQAAILNAQRQYQLSQMQAYELAHQSWVQTAWQNAVTWAGSTLQGGATWMGSILQNGATWASGILTGSATTWGSTASWVGDALQSAAGFTWDAMSSIGSGLFKLAASEVPGVGAAMSAMAGGPVAMLAAFFVDLFSSTWQFQAIIDRATAIMQPLISVAGDLIAALWPLIQVSLNLMRLGLQPVIWALQNIVNPVFTFVARAIASVWNAIANTLNRVLGWMGVRIPTVNVNAGPPPTNQQRQDKARQNEQNRQEAERRRRQEWQNVEQRRQAEQRAQERNRRDQEQVAERKRREAEEKRRRREREVGKQPGQKAPGRPGSPSYKPPSSPGYKAPKAPGRPGSPSYKAPGKIGSPGRGSSPGYSAPGGGSGGGGGTKVSEITGPTRDFLADAFSSFVALPELVGIQTRMYNLLEANLGGAPNINVGMPALTAGPNITNHIHMVASGDLRYDADQLTKEVSLRLAKAMQAQKRGSGG